jgi:hypothetical protein
MKQALNSVTSMSRRELQSKEHKLVALTNTERSRGSSVSIVTGFRFPVGEGTFPLRHRVQTDSGAHLASYLMGIGGSFPEDKVAGVWS